MRHDRYFTTLDLLLYKGFFSFLIQNIIGMQINQSIKYTKNILCICNLRNLNIKAVEWNYPHFILCVYMLSKSRKVTIENQVREKVFLAWIWNPNFGDEYFVYPLSHSGRWQMQPIFNWKQNRKHQFYWDQGIMPNVRLKDDESKKLKKSLELCLDK